MSKPWRMNNWICSSWVFLERKRGKLLVFLSQICSALCVRCTSRNKSRHCVYAYNWDYLLISFHFWLLQMPLQKCLWFNHQNDSSLRLTIIIEYSISCTKSILTLKKLQHFCNAVQSPLSNNIVFPTFIILNSTKFYF